MAQRQNAETSSHGIVMDSLQGPQQRLSSCVVEKGQIV